MSNLKANGLPKAPKFPRVGPKNPCDNFPHHTFDKGQVMTYVKKGYTPLIKQSRTGSTVNGICNATESIRDKVQDKPRTRAKGRTVCPARHAYRMAK